jgi:hypothetical protein
MGRLKCLLCKKPAIFRFKILKTTVCLCGECSSPVLRDSSGSFMPTKVCLRRVELELNRPRKPQEVHHGKAEVCKIG